MKLSPLNRAFPLLMVLAVVPTLMAPMCGTDKGSSSGDTGAGGGDGADGGADGGGTDGTEPGEEEIAGTIGGTVTVELYTLDEAGERIYTSYEESTGGAFPWDKIFVGAYTQGESGAEHYVGTSVIDGATTGANPYSIEFKADEPTSVFVYASLDYYADNVVGSTEPRGVWPVEIPLADGDSITGIDITILAPLPGGGGGCTDTVTMSGEALVTVHYAGGDVAVMLADTGGNGPYHVGALTPVANGDGASGPYSFESCSSYGDMNLIGAWDSDGDTMYSPADHWGAFISAPDTDGNPVNVATNDLAGYDVQIPLGEYAGINVVPFVTVGGDVRMDDGSAFDSLPTGAAVYVVALKYAPNTDLSVSEIEGASYGFQKYEWADLTGHSSLPYQFAVPSNTLVYLWAYVDADLDGVLNEDGEAVALGGLDANGRLVITTESVSNDLLLAERH
jgi:hypothetical protein